MLGKQVPSPRCMGFVRRVWPTKINRKERSRGFTVDTSIKLAAPRKPVQVVLTLRKQQANPSARNEIVNQEGRNSNRQVT